MKSLEKLLASIALAGLVPGLSFAAAQAPDLSKVDRHIGKEPTYVADRPLYGLYVFGPDARTRVWAVLDKSKKDGLVYDVLYFDRNATGDLAESAVRIVGTADNSDNVMFNVGSFTDPATSYTHTNITISCNGGQNGRVFLRMKWRDKNWVMGGYAEDPGPYTQFAAKPEDAPVLWPGADGPLSFQRWCDRQLTIGRADDMRVFLGHQGHGRHTFCGLEEHFLPSQVPVLATLIYTDAGGRERRAQSELRERC
jgi:hypothetical protein